MAKGKIGKNARVSGLMSKVSDKDITVENDNSRGKVFVEVKKLLTEANIGFQNLSSSHPILINKGCFQQACSIAKGALVEGETSRYKVENEDASQVVLLENAPKDPAKMVIRESPFSWYSAS
jgi:hypothetical protein